MDTEHSVQHAAAISSSAAEGSTRHARAQTRSEWRGFKQGQWQHITEVRDFIQKNHVPYLGNAEFLEGTTDKTEKLWQKCIELLKEEAEKGGVLGVDCLKPSTITSHSPGYIERELETIVGLQTEKPLVRAIKPKGGIKLVEKACEQYGCELNPVIKEIFTKHRKTHNDAVFDAYTDEIKKLRSAGVITGLPDNYGRGRIIGDYRRVALYGIDMLIKHKKEDLAGMDANEPFLREEVANQITALHELKEMAKSYGFDIGKPASNAFECVQWTWFGYLAAIKEQDGAAMSFGRPDSFFDIYIERDIKAGILDEKSAQELIDQIVIKMRLVRQLRPKEYSEIFAGDPNWVTVVLGGTTSEPLVSKTSYRFLQTLRNLGPAPEPNLTVLWSSALPKEFKEFAAQISIETSSLQYENDDLMNTYFSDDYSIACCVSAMRTGKEMQFFGARCNGAKVLLLAINGGKDEITGEQIAPELSLPQGEYLDYDEVKNNFLILANWVAKNYVEAMNTIHAMHDKYNYEAVQMALHDTKVKRYMAFGLAGLSVLADSFSAIKYAKVKPLRDERGIATDFSIEGTFPCYGNDDARADHIAVEGVVGFNRFLKKYPTYRHAEHTLSILTITSNVMYGKKTGATPDGRKAGEPFAPGANPMHGRDCCGAVASLNSVAKLPFSSCLDGISNTFSVVPEGLGKSEAERAQNLVGLMDGYFAKGAQHINVNVLNREMLRDAMEHPEKYPLLTIRVSGYAVNFNRLSKEQQLEVINRSFHEKI
ncbi:formate C-acetyltransferase [Candidatus Micrarchaeota archaeon]|nr:formate C-acetyltransferase [Candidatus Micrarchaeota archaeon]